ncbi:MAG: TIGR04348 family glycosyltransferase [Rhodospirillales bacterium]|nr:TIGR04348 family glycosyltransferase [Rhodospirillales bacterium]
MRINLITPAKPGSRAGNRATAVRWARHLRALGHRVTITTEYRGGEADAMIALHAWRSADAIRRFAKDFPDRPLIVALTGTDIHRFQFSHPVSTRRSMALADRLVTLHDQVAAHIPARFRNKISVVHQSARPLARRPKPPTSQFEVCVVGHLRAEKDPLRTAYAARLLPMASRVRVTQLGQAIGPEWARAAEVETARNSRYRWLGEVSHGQVRETMRKSRVMVISSVMEGGANVVSEAAVAGLPVIASRIPGNVGLLGRNYPGYFAVKDTRALARLLRRAEEQPDFFARLKRAVAKRAKLFRIARERRMLKAALKRAVAAARERSRSVRAGRSAR